MDKSTILAMLRAWVNQRPGLEFCNYGDVSAYRAELRQITKDRAHALELIRAVEWRDSITAERIIAAFPRAYSGRLRLEKREKDGKWVLDYCTGQYWPTEYRKAVCAVLASALWDWAREECMPQPDRKPEACPCSRDHSLHHHETYNGLRAGDWLRRFFRREFGVSIARRWFS